MNATLDIFPDGRALAVRLGDNSRIYGEAHWTDKGNGLWEVEVHWDHKECQVDSNTFEKEKYYYGRSMFLMKYDPEKKEWAST